VSDYSYHLTHDDDQGSNPAGPDRHELDGRTTGGSRPEGTMTPAQRNRRRLARCGDYDRQSADARLALEQTHLTEFQS
jgi:hypothetical protein